MSGNPFRQEVSNKKPNPFFDSGPQKRGLSDKEKQWGKKKFTPSSAFTGKVQAPTPWVKYKDDIIKEIQTQADNSASSIESKEAKEFLKKRNKNYRKMIITEKQKEPTQWEDFDDEKATHYENKKNRKTSHNTQEKSMSFQETVSHTVNKPGFKSADLNFAQNNYLRKLITKTAAIANNVSFKASVKAMKRTKELKRLKSKNA